VPPAFLPRDTRRTRRGSPAFTASMLSGFSYGKATRAFLPTVPLSPINKETVFPKPPGNPAPLSSHTPKEGPVVKERA
jgi:hypothetical protein